MNFHHFGLAVRKSTDAEVFLRRLGYQIGEKFFDENQNVHLAMCVHDSQPSVEIITPGNGGGPTDSLISRLPKGVIYHVCYETSDLAAALAGLENAGLNVVCVSEPKPALLFGGRKVSFYNVIGIGLIEILETENQ